MGYAMMWDMEICGIRDYAGSGIMWNRGLCGIWDYLGHEIRVWDLVCGTNDEAVVNRGY